MTIGIELLAAIIGFVITVASFYLKISNDNKKASEAYGIQQGELKVTLKDIGEDIKHISDKVESIEKEVQSNHLSAIKEIGDIKNELSIVRSIAERAETAAKKAHDRIDVALFKKGD